MSVHSKLLKSKNKIIELSYCKSQYEIAKLFNCAQADISKILGENKIKHKKSRLNMSHLALNINYFKEINSPDKAYWLGFICADGNINKLNNKVSLISKDIEVVEGFKNAIGAEHKISKREVFDKRTNKTYTGYSIQIGNELFTQNLINLGVTSNKTNILEFPNIEEKYYSYFIAGLFDGDGSVYWKGKYKNHLGINLISTQEVLKFICEYLYVKLNIKPKYSDKVTKNKSNVWRIYLFSDAHKFLKFIYQDSNFEYYLKRKYLIYIKNVDLRPNTRYIKKICQYDSKLQLIKIWDTQQEIATFFNFPATTLNSYLNKYKNKQYKNYYWRYEE